MGQQDPAAKPGTKGTGQAAPQATDDAGREDAPRTGYIPRPPSQSDVDRVSEAQGMITDEWSGEPEAERPSGPPPERQRNPPPRR